MKRFYTVLWMLLVCILAFAKSVTFKIDNPDAVSVYDPNTYQVATWGADNSLTLTVEGYASIRGEANQGFIIKNMVDTENTTCSFGETYFNLYSSEFNDGEIYTITTAEKEPTILVIKADPETVYMTYMEQEYGAEQQVDGAWRIVEPELYSSIYVYAKENYMLSSIINPNGGEELWSLMQTAYINTYNLKSGENVYTVEAVDLSKSRTDFVTVTVDGDVSKVALQRNMTGSVTLTDGTNEVWYDPKTEVPFTISSANYSISLYKVTLNGNTVAPQGSSWSVEPQNGDEIVIYTEFPDKDVPVKFNFVNEGTEAAISAVMVNDEAVPASEWSKDNFTVKLGSNLSVAYSNLFNISAVTVNGENASTWSYSTTVKNEDGYEFNITATKKATIKYTLVCNDPEQIQVEYGYNNPQTLTGTSTELEVVDGDYTPLRILPANGYVITKVESDKMGDLTNNRTNIRITETQTITVTSEKFIRPFTGTIYLAPAEWLSTNLTLGQYTDTRSEMALKEGYNFFEFAESDKPFTIGAYSGPNMTVYLNGNVITPTYGTYEDLRNYEEGDIIKIYPEPVAPYPVKVEIEDGIKDCAIIHDFYNFVEESGQFTVLPGTIIMFSYMGDTEIDIKSNGVEVPVDETYGCPALYVQEPVNITITKKEQNSIHDILSGKNTCNDVYNMQGILVKRAATADDINALPAGLYIVGNKKIAVR